MKEKVNKLKKTLQKLAPRIFELSLNSGANEDEILDLEHTIDKPLPKDFKEFYKLINGNNQDENFGNFFYGLSLSSIEEISMDWHFRKSMLETTDLMKLNKNSIEIENSTFYNLNWIRIATDGGRDGLYLDLEPSKNGFTGQIIYLEGTALIGLYVAKSFEELIQTFIDDLQNENYYLASDALEDGHHWLETKDNIDLVKKVFQI